MTSLVFRTASERATIRLTGVRERVIIALLVATIAIAVQDATPVTPPNGAHGDFAGTVDVGERALQLNCLGEGGPTVLLESGSPFMTMVDWEPAQAQIAMFTRVCSYDQRNAGQRDAVAIRRSTQRTADDLNALLTAAGVPGPYVLVSTSIESSMPRLYANQHPEDVAGVLVIVPPGEALETSRPEASDRALYQQRAIDRRAGDPDSVALAVRSLLFPARAH